MEEDTSIFHSLDIPMNEKALTVFNNALNYALGKHSKLLVIREDVSFPKEMPNEMAQELIKPYNRKLREKWKNDGYAPVYIAAREINSEGRVHYHEAWFLNGHKTWKTYERFKESEQVLQRVIGSEYDVKGLIDHCDNGHRNGIMVKRDDPDSTDLHEVQRQISYLAKIKQKDNVKGKKFFTSRIN